MPYLDKADQRARYHERKLRGQCVQSGCPHKASPGRGNRCSGCANYLVFLKQVRRGRA